MIGPKSKRMAPPPLPQIAFAHGSRCCFHQQPGRILTNLGLPLSTTVCHNLVLSSDEAFVSGTKDAGMLPQWILYAFSVLAYVPSA